MKRIFVMLLFFSILLLSSCGQNAETTETTKGETKILSQPPVFSTYDLNSFDQMREALFEQEGWAYQYVRTERELHPTTAKRLEPYARMLELYEQSGTFPMPYYGGKSMEEWVLEKQTETRGTETSLTIMPVEFFGLPCFQYVAFNHSLSWGTPMIRISPLAVSDDPLMQKYSDITAFYSEYSEADLEAKGWESVKLQLADRTVKAYLTPFDEEEGGRIRYVFLYDGMLIRIIDTPEVLTDEFWSSFSIGEASK